MEHSEGAITLVTSFSSLFVFVCAMHTVYNILRIPCLSHKEATLNDS